MDQDNNQVVWEIIDSLDEGSLRKRADQLRGKLSEISPEKLLEYYRDASAMHRSLFRKDILNAYLILFEGEANKSGFVDFCSNLILQGREVYAEVTAHPDHLLALPDLGQMNEDFMHVSETALEMLSESQTEEELERLVLRVLGKEFFEQKNVWKVLEENGVSFQIDAEYAKDVIPGIVRKR